MHKEMLLNNNEWNRLYFGFHDISPNNFFLVYHEKIIIW